MLLYRDELSGFFRSLERPGHEADRAFYLECWNGDGAFTYDRIGRGTLHIAGVCLSIVGGIQPGPLSDIVRGLRGAGDDGLLQRFQLAVWPDLSPDWQNVDRLPDRDAQEAVQAIVERLDGAVHAIPCTDAGGIPVLRFSDEAQALFDQWREGLELRLRMGEEHLALEAHLAKYRSLVPSLALVIHLTEKSEGPVNTLPLIRAIAWVEYLETHAHRIYSPAITPDMDAARALSKRIKAGDVGARFSLREVYNRGWSGLSTRDKAFAAVQVLIDHLDSGVRGVDGRAPADRLLGEPRRAAGIGSTMNVLDRVRAKYRMHDPVTCKTSKSPSAGFAGSSAEQFASASPRVLLEGDARRRAILAARDAAGLENWRAALREGRLHLCANCTRFTFGVDPAGAGHCARYDTTTYPFVTMLRCAGFQPCASQTPPAPDYLADIGDCPTYRSA